MKQFLKDTYDKILRPHLNENQKQYRKVPNLRRTIKCRLNPKGV